MKIKTSFSHCTFNNNVGLGLGKETTYARALESNDGDGLVSYINGILGWQNENKRNRTSRPLLHKSVV